VSASKKYGAIAERIIDRMDPSIDPPPRSSRALEAGSTGGHCSSAGLTETRVRRRQTEGERVRAHTLDADARRVGGRMTEGRRRGGRER